MELLGGAKDRAVMVGDSRKDLGAAKNAGIDSILFYPPDHSIYYDIDELKSLKPTQIATSFEDILSSLEN